MKYRPVNKPKLKIRKGTLGANDVSMNETEYPNEPATATKRHPNRFIMTGNIGPVKKRNCVHFSNNVSNIDRKSDVDWQYYRS